MTMKALGILATVLSILAEPIGAWEEPTGFRNIPWDGMHLRRS